MLMIDSLVSVLLSTESRPGSTPTSLLSKISIKIHVLRTVKIRELKQ